MTILERQTMLTPANWVPGPQQGDWTYHHYAALSDDGQRYEILDGVLYNMSPSPSEAHQTTTGRLFYHLFMYTEVAGLGRVYVAPMDVELAPKIVVQPDVLVVLNEGMHKITPSHIIGAPDLVVEVASPSTSIYDRHAKRDAYARAGIPEYWIADPTAQTIEVFILEGDTYYSAGVFSGEATLHSKIVPTIADVAASQFFL